MLYLNISCANGQKPYPIFKRLGNDSMYRVPTHPYVQVAPICKVTLPTPVRIAGLPGGYFVIMNKINLVPFFCTIHVMFFNIQMHNYLCFCSVQFPNLLFLVAVQMKHYPLLPQVRIIFAGEPSRGTCLFFIIGRRRQNLSDVRLETCAVSSVFISEVF